MYMALSPHITIIGGNNDINNICTYIQFIYQEADIKQLQPLQQVR